MLYKACSINQVIARIVRNTRLQDSSFLADFNEWIPEAMGYLGTKFVLRPVYEDVNIVFHKGKLPCNLEHLDAVEYCGRRLHTSDSIKNYATGHNLTNSTVPSNDNAVLFKSIIYTTPNQTYIDENNLMYASTNFAESDPLLQYQAPDFSATDWYGIEANFITTSFREGTVRLHFMARPTDSNDLPLIPDNEDYKQALYYYVRAMMIGAGFDDKVFNYNDCMQRFELHAGRAMAEITYPTPDQREQTLKATIRFIPPANYWENFFRVEGSEPMIG